jgi:putative chitinase
MFPGVITEAEIPVIETGLPSLNREMLAAEITTPRRIAAFLTTLRFESRFRYNIHQFNDTRPYAGRGFIQLTGKVLPDGDVMNYGPCGRYLGIDLIGNPDLALTLEWSAKIARWYWTVARPNCNAYADALRMGKVNAAIGYPRSPDGSNDNARCAAFQKALQYLTKGPLEPVDCAR